MIGKYNNLIIDYNLHFSTDSHGHVNVDELNFNPLNA